MIKIYSDDPYVHYKDSEISPERTKANIDGVLAEWQVKDILWHWDPEHFDISVQFKIEEIIDSLPVSVVVRVECPIIYDREKLKGRPPKPEAVNLRISMRCMWHFIKTHLEMAYAMHSSKTVAFLPYIATGERKTLKDVILPRLKQFQALEERKDSQEKIIEMEPRG